MVGLCIALLWTACEGLPPETVLPLTVSDLPVEPVPSDTEPAPPERTPEVPARVFRAVYRITTEPPGVGVYRELGELAGVTPLTLEFQFERITRLTFVRTGYLIQSKILEPLDGEHSLHIVMEPNTR